MRLLILMLLITSSSCLKIPVKPTEGKIVTIMLDDCDSVRIELEFYDKYKDRTYYAWYTGADTCKLGQIVRLR